MVLAEGAPRRAVACALRQSAGERRRHSRAQEESSVLVCWRTVGSFIRRQLLASATKPATAERCPRIHARSQRAVCRHKNVAAAPNKIEQRYLLNRAETKALLFAGLAWPAAPGTTTQRPGLHSYGVCFRYAHCCQSSNNATPPWILSCHHRSRPPAPRSIQLSGIIIASYYQQF